MGLRHPSRRSDRQVDGFTLVELMVVLVILALATPIVLKIALVPPKTSATANNFQQAERAAEIYALRSERDGALFATVPEGCSVEMVNEEFEVHKITCTRGNHEQVRATAEANIFLVDRNPYTGDYSDDDFDGYEDNTGLPTHYDECYSGWKGTTGSGFKDAACDVGGQYVIPLYANLYD